MNLRAPIRFALRSARRAGAALLALMSFTSLAQAQEKHKDDEDLEVTMQVIQDPESKQPNEVLQRIPLPRRQGETNAGTPGKEKTRDQDADKAKDKAKNDNSDRSDSNDQRRDGDEGRDAPDRAKERAREAREERNEARHEDNRREHDESPGKPPKDHHPGRERGHSA